MNAKDWRDEMSRIRDELREGKISVQAANTLIKALSAISVDVRNELKYREMRGEKPEISHFSKG